MSFLLKVLFRKKSFNADLPLFYRIQEWWWMQKWKDVNFFISCNYVARRLDYKSQAKSLHFGFCLLNTIKENIQELNYFNVIIPPQVLWCQIVRNLIQYINHFTMIGWWQEGSNYQLDDISSAARILGILWFHWIFLFIWNYYMFG